VGVVEVAAEVGAGVAERPFSLAALAQGLAAQQGGLPETLGEAQQQTQARARAQAGELPQVLGEVQWLRPEASQGSCQREWGASRDFRLRDRGARHQRGPAPGVREAGSWEEQKGRTGP
jgi:hypothetical protein